MKSIPKPIKGTGKNKRARIKALKKRLQWAFNAYVVLRDGECFTCGGVNNLQASHYFSVASSPATRYDETNVHAQCARCHMEAHNKGGYRYAMAMLNKYGVDKMDKLLLASSSSAEYSEEWLRERIDYYSKQIAELNNKEFSNSD